MATKNKAIKLVMRSIETLCRADPSVYSLGSWVGKELKLEMGNLEPAYISFEMNSDDTKYRVKTFNCFPELNGTIHIIGDN